MNASNVLQTSVLKKMFLADGQNDLAESIAAQWK